MTFSPPPACSVTSDHDVRPTDLDEFLTVVKPCWMESVPTIRDHFASVVGAPRRVKYCGRCFFNFALIASSKHSDFGRHFMSTVDLH
jgi:hypothetical protein